MNKTHVARNVLSTTPLGGGATYTSPALDVPKGVTRIAVAAFADQTGNVFVDQSRDGATWRAPAGQAVTASQLLVLEVRLVLPFVRVRLVNGATPQTVLDLNMALLGD